MSDEDEYFHKLSLEAKARLRAKLDAEMSEKEAEERKQLHFHKCGKCGSDLTSVMFRGIEIERCGNCGAVLLDPGELEQLAGEDQTAVFASFFSMFKRDRD
ncbi:MAG: zf-TFIIB domain-containing protein [Myxococcota bacterium]